MQNTFADWSRRRPVARIRAQVTASDRRQRRVTMKNPLDSLWGTIISGLVLTAILYYVVRSMLM
jgi:hypothetical protein